ncbi:hypothetical protein PROFUN_06292 [Planoprotostelium fungivorum]|uniref:Uncharacterized protein n=1 Tax=Planoprotostelium fungivorum TaxID=1890364 RepID=A0A2P6NEA5_9EUKA|nr:hypothetical protein PROFUN_06292 [Planoprotostelium fungivorum]
MNVPFNPATAPIASTTYDSRAATTGLHAQPALYSTSAVPNNYGTYYQYEKAPKTVISGSHQGAQVSQTQVPQKRQGFFGKVESILHRGAEQLGVGTDTQSRWAMFGINEPLFAEFPCKVANGTTYNRGYGFVSANHFAFSSFTDGQGQAIKFLIPLSQIAHINQAQRVKSTAQGGLVFAPITSAAMRPNALQLITKDNQLHQIFGLKQTDNVYNVLRHSMATQQGAYPAAATGYPAAAAPTHLV